MRDPRLLEIDLLMDLETRRQLQVRSTEAEWGSRAGEGRKLYGADAPTFRALVIDLLMQGYVVGLKLMEKDAYGIDEKRIRDERQLLLAQLTQGLDIVILISHAGRVRLWTLRDELLRNPDIEPMGLRSKAAWERDLFLRLRWATEGEPLAIIFLDLDNFGAVNKDLGATIGDDVLRATFAIARNLVGSRGHVYRFGGEEVGVLLPNTTLDAAHGIADELRAMIETEVVRRVPQLGRPQTASLGVSAFTASIEPRAAVEQVDALMRAAKDGGKNRVVSQ